MKKMFLVIAMIVAMTASMMAYGQNVTAMGDISCGVWIKNIEDEKKNPNDMSFKWINHANSVQLNGYINGLMIMDGALKNLKGANPLKNTNTSSLTLWMENYCRKSPLNGLYDGGFELYLELKYKK